MIPLVRRITARLSILGAQSGGEGTIERLEPAGVIEQIDEVSRQIPIKDATGATMRAMFIAAVAFGGFLWMARRIFPRRRTRDER